MRLHSDLLHDPYYAPARPADLPWMHGWDLIPLVSYATERMSVAINLIDSISPAERCRQRLCHWAGDVSAEAHKLQLGKVIQEILDDYPPRSYAAVGSWLDGRWHPSRDGLIDLLWRIQLTPRTVATAGWLHDRGTRSRITTDTSTAESWIS